VSETSSLRVVVPVTSRLPVSVEAPVTSRPLDNVAAPLTVRELPSVVTPLTPSVPAAAVLPEASTVNLFVATLISAVVSRVPLMVTEPAAMAMRSSFALVPMLLPVNRTSSTLTYPFVLVMSTPPLAALCVIAADAFSMRMLSFTVAAPVTESVLNKVVP